MSNPLAVTPGDPAGIGPDLCLQLACEPTQADVSWFAIADPEALSQRARTLNLPVEIREYRNQSPDSGPNSGNGRLQVLPIPLSAPAQPGRPDPAHARPTLDALREAMDGCLQGRYGALVTGPVNKAVINQAGVPFTGHTEFLAERTRAHPVMMLATPGLRVALVTTHLPLRQVSAAITPERLEKTLRIVDRDLRRRFGLAAPRLLVCGLNPHAGEQGHLGREEIDIIQPVINRLRTEGLDITGPLPADTLFTPSNLETADVVVAMYHDQGLPVLKHKGFGNAVNITLGLPILRTSVDHGTAYDLAGTGRADTGSLRAALQTAAVMVRHQQKPTT